MVNDHLVTCEHHVLCKDLSSRPTSADACALALLASSVQTGLHTDISQSLLTHTCILTFQERSPSSLTLVRDQPKSHPRHVFDTHADLCISCRRSDRYVVPVAIW